MMRLRYLLIIFLVVGFSQKNIALTMDDGKVEKIIFKYDNQNFYKENEIMIDEILQLKKNIFFINEIFIKSIDNVEFKQFEEHYSFKNEETLQEKKLNLLNEILEEEINTKIFNKVLTLKKSKSIRTIIPKIEEMFREKQIEKEKVLDIYYIGSAVDILYPQIKGEFIENLEEISDLEINLFLGSNLNEYYKNLKEWELKNIVNSYPYNTSQKKKIEEIIYETKLEMISQTLINNGINIIE